MIDDHSAAINRTWILVSSGMIFLMQAGFSLIESGSVRLKSSANILTKNLFDS
jgi:Amt family ammonium transporter